VHAYLTYCAAAFCSGGGGGYYGLWSLGVWWVVQESGLGTVLVIVLLFYFLGGLRF